MALWIGSGGVCIARGLAMKALATFLLLLCVSASGQSLREVLDHGEQVFNITCATGYCHAPEGGLGGGASRLAGRGFEQDYIRRATASGLPGTAMPAFGELLSAGDLSAVVAYVAVLNEIDSPVLRGVLSSTETATRTTPALSAVAQEGRVLFHESVRGFSRCATCHRVAGSGVPVSEPLVEVPVSAEALRRLETSDGLSTVTLKGESMPAVIVSRGTRRSLFYDLTVPPPVLRTVESDALQIEQGSSWQHNQSLGTYNDEELEKILAYLGEALQPD